MKTAMSTSIGSDADEAAKALSGRGISMSIVKTAIGMMNAQGSGFTLFNAVDALTRLTGRLSNAGDRNEQDTRIGSLLALAV